MRPSCEDCGMAFADCLNCCCCSWCGCACETEPEEDEQDCGLESAA